MPSKAEVMTATLAGPPEAQPATALEMSMKNWPRPVFSRKEPKRMKRKMKVLETPMGVPKTPSVVNQKCSVRDRMLTPRWANMPGRWGPAKA